MKCPKCGFNSFEFLDSCKKCNHDLTSFKEARGIRSVFLQGLSRAAAEPDTGKEAGFVLTAAATAADEELFGEKGTTAESPSQSASDFGLSFGSGEDDATNFSFAPETAPEATPAAEELTFGDFSFEDVAQPQEQPAAPAQEFVDDSFADLLESSGSGEGTASPATDGFVGFGDLAGEEPAAESPAASGGGVEMDFFFQEDEAAGKDVPKRQPTDTEEGAADSFDSLFGELPEEPEHTDR